VGILVSDPATGRVLLLDPDLRLVRILAAGLRRPTGVACDDDHVYVIETARHRVVVFGHDGVLKSSIGRRGTDVGQFNFPTAVAFDGPTLVVGDTLNFRVQRLDPETGAFRSAFGRLGDVPGEMPRLKGMAFDAAGQLWVSDAHTDTVSLFTPAGALLVSLGGRGTAPGRFSFPAGVAASKDGRIAVVDAFNRRVQVFRLLGRSES
jgi:DNA-binding beta-propeller fold protein YncE